MLRQTLRGGLCYHHDPPGLKEGTVFHRPGSRFTSMVPCHRREPFTLMRGQFGARVAVPYNLQGKIVSEAPLLVSTDPTSMAPVSLLLVQRQGISGAYQ